MNLGDIRRRLARILNFNDTNVDQDFTATDLNDAINEAYEEELAEAGDEAGPTNFERYLDLTWLEINTTFTIPDSLQGKQILSIFDLTNSTRGLPIWMGGRQSESDVIWLDSNTMAWGTTGPGQDRTLRFFFTAVPSPMSLDSDTPELIPRQFHRLLVWSAACVCLDAIDHEAPARWLRRRDAIRMEYWKFLSMERPIETAYPTSTEYASRG